VIKPYPFLLLNHLTVPAAIILILFTNRLIRNPYSLADKKNPILFSGE